MKKRITQLVKHPLISGSAILFIGSLMSSFINFVYNLFMSRNLTVSDYGILASIMSLVILATLPAGAVIPMVINFSGSYFAKEEYGKIKDLFFKVFKFTFLLGGLILLIMYVFQTKIGLFFNIKTNSFIVYAGFIVFIGFIGVVNNALLQARLSFKFITFSNLFSAIVKLILGILLVYIGFAVGGAIFAVMISFFIPYIISFIPLNFIFKKDVVNSKIEIKSLLSYGAPAALTTFCLTSLITTDILLVKHFFDPKSAGIYAGISLVGRVIFFFSAPIGTVMFPLIVQKHTKQEKYHDIFLLSIFLVFAASISIAAFYFIFPEFSIKFFLKKDEYLSAAPLIGIFGIFITIYSLASIFVTYFLSIKKTNVFVFVLLAAILQAFLIVIFHQSFIQIILISMFVAGLLLILLLLYYLRLQHKEKIYFHEKSE